jgi:hypothetical protein
MSFVFDLPPQACAPDCASSLGLPQRLQFCWLLEWGLATTSQLY